MTQVEVQITAILVHYGKRVSSGTLQMQIDTAKQYVTLKTQEVTMENKPTKLK